MYEPPFLKGVQEMRTNLFNIVFDREDQSDYMLVEIESSIDPNELIVMLKRWVRDFSNLQLNPAEPSMERWIEYNLLLSGVRNFKYPKHIRLVCE